VTTTGEWAGRGWRVAIDDRRLTVEATNNELSLNVEECADASVNHRWLRNELRLGHAKGSRG
jgi:hypothetical protein